MRFKLESPVHRTLLGLFAGAFSVAFGMALGAVGVQDPYATYFTVAFAIIFILSFIGILI